MNLRRTGLARSSELAWVERCMRVLAAHYFSHQVEVTLEPSGAVYLYATTRGRATHEIARGPTLGDALEVAIAKLSDAELLAALELVGP